MSVAVVARRCVPVYSTATRVRTQAVSLCLASCLVAPLVPTPSRSVRPPARDRRARAGRACSARRARALPAPRRCARARRRAPASPRRPPSRRAADSARAGGEARADRADRRSTPRCRRPRAAPTRVTLPAARDRERRTRRGVLPAPARRAARRAAAPVRAARRDPFGDLDLQFNGRSSRSCERTRERPLRDRALRGRRFGCRSRFQPAFDFQFNVQRAGGVVAERVHLNVDYDTQREFDASNDISACVPGQARRATRPRRGRQRLVRAAGVALPHGRHPEQQLRRPGHRPFGPHALARDRRAAEGNVVQRDRVFTVGDRIAADADAHARRLPDRAAPLLLHGRSAAAAAATRTSTCSIGRR